jgi:flagellar capping protein FliD
LKTGTTDVTVSQSATGVENAFFSFATAYNSVIVELNQNRGQNGGPLSGQSVIYQFQDALRSLANFSTGNGSIKSLASLGLSFDDSGNLNFDSTTFGQTAASAGGDLLDFIGTSASGGFLQAANNLVTSITDSSTGILTQASEDTANQLTTLATKISADQSQITQLQQSLTKQMADADAAISSLEQQLTEITDLFSTMQANEKASG